MLVCLALVACAAAPPPPDEVLCSPPSRPTPREVARPRPHVVIVARGPIESALLQRIDDALTVPVDAVSLDEDGARVFVVDEGHARARRVAVGIRQGDRLQVVEGLREGDRVLTPARLARDGDAVE